MENQDISQEEIDDMEKKVLDHLKVVLNKLEERYSGIKRIPMEAMPSGKYAGEIKEVQAKIREINEFAEQNFHRWCDKTGGCSVFGGESCVRLEGGCSGFYSLS